MNITSWPVYELGADRPSPPIRPVREPEWVAERLTNVKRLVPIVPDLVDCPTGDDDMAIR